MIDEENVFDLTKNKIVSTPVPRAGGRAGDRGRFLS